MRTLTPELDAALRARTVYPVILWELLGHPAGDLRLWTGHGTLAYGGNNWTGAGIIVQVSPNEDSTEVAVTRQVITVAFPDLSPLGEDQVAKILAIITTPVKRLVVNRYRAFLDRGGQVIPDPLLQFKGYTDAPRLLDGSDGTRTVQLQIQGPVIGLTSPLRTQLSNEEQVAKFPDDTGLSLMASLPNKELTWKSGAYNGFAP